MYVELKKTHKKTFTISPCFTVLVPTTVTESEMEKYSVHPLTLISLVYIYKHIQFNTITYKQKGKRVEPPVLKLIYSSLISLFESSCLY